MELADLRRSAREIFSEALKSVDAGRAVRRAVQLEGSRLTLVDTTFDLTTPPTSIYAVAIGKAALPMAAALNDALGDHLSAGVISAPPISLPESNDSSNTPTTFPFSQRWQVFAGGHPLPNEESLAAARATFDLLRGADATGALVIFLISGGGSAMIEWPRDPRITLEELQAANRALISCGASIAEINAARRAFSAVKGGGLATRAPRARQVSLIVSDTNAGRERDVASGPTFEQQDDPGVASMVVRYGLASLLPPSILRAIDELRPTKATRQLSGHHYVLLDNRDGIRAAAEAARARGFTVEAAHDLVEQPIAEGSAQLLTRLSDLRGRATSEHHPVCLISGGEFACPLKGDGTGGRNSETALRCAIEIDARSKGQRSMTHTICLSAGTDGIDGNSPAAGAIADETTLERARLKGLDAQSFLDRSDAYTFFESLGDAIITGRTGTNVRDLRLMLAS
jgi:hydroxypyruvate reductase